MTQQQPAAADGAVPVEVCAALTGGMVCRVRAHRVSDLKAMVENECGVYRLDQWLTLGQEVLQDSFQLSAVIGPTPLVVDLLHRRTLAGAVWRALGRLGDAESETAASSLNGELAELREQSMKQLEDVSADIVEKALSARGSSEGCAEVALAVHARCQQAPIGHWGEGADAFRTALRGMCQVKYQDLRVGFLFLTDEEMQQQETEARLLSMVRLSAHLFERGLLPLNHLRVIACDLTSGELPEEHFVDCACEMLLLAGPSMDKLHSGASFLTQMMLCLSKLATACNPFEEEEEMAYSDRLVERIQSLIELRTSGWCAAEVPRDPRSQRPSPV